LGRRMLQQTQITLFNGEHAISSPHTDFCEASSVALYSGFFRRQGSRGA
jgi:hypothetical protein